jgi:hypothetical protein
MVPTALHVRPSGASVLGSKRKLLEGFEPPTLQLRLSLLPDGVNRQNASSFRLSLGALPLGASHFCWCSNTKED